MAEGPLGQVSPGQGRQGLGQEAVHGSFQLQTGGFQGDGTVHPRHLRHGAARPQVQQQRGRLVAPPRSHARSQQEESQSLRQPANGSSQQAHRIAREVDHDQALPLHHLQGLAQGLQLDPEEVPVDQELPAGQVQDGAGGVGDHVQQQLGPLHGCRVGQQGDWNPVGRQACRKVSRLLTAGHGGQGQASPGLGAHDPRSRAGHRAGHRSHEGPGLPETGRHLVVGAKSILDGQDAGGVQPGLAGLGQGGLDGEGLDCQDEPVAPSLIRSEVLQAGDSSDRKPSRAPLDLETA